MSGLLFVAGGFWLGIGVGALLWAWYLWRNLRGTHA
jgi:hypothetical protein